MATTVIVDCTVQTTESPTLAALQARRETREQRQAGLLQRLSNLRSLRAQLFDIKKKHSVVLTGGEDDFQKEVDLIVAEIAKLKALREREAHMTEPRPLPPWLQFPAPAAADDFLRRLQQAELRDASGRELGSRGRVGEGRSQHGGGRGRREVCMPVGFRRLSCHDRAHRLRLVASSPRLASALKCRLERWSASGPAEPRQPPG